MLSVSVAAILGKDFGAHSALLEEGNHFMCGTKRREISLWPHFLNAGFLTTEMLLSNSVFRVAPKVIRKATPALFHKEPCRRIYPVTGQ